jgi:hypothetical protein
MIEYDFPFNVLQNESENFFEIGVSRHKMLNEKKEQE